MGQQKPEDSQKNHFFSFCLFLCPRTQPILPWFLYLLSLTFNKEISTPVKGIFLSIKYSPNFFPACLSLPFKLIIVSSMEIPITSRHREQCCFDNNFLPVEDHSQTTSQSCLLSAEKH